MRFDRRAPPWLCAFETHPWRREEVRIADDPFRALAADRDAIDHARIPVLVHQADIVLAAWDIADAEAAAGLEDVPSETILAPQKSISRGDEERNDKGGFVDHDDASLLTGREASMGEDAEEDGEVAQERHDEAPAPRPRKRTPIPID